MGRISLKQYFLVPMMLILSLSQGTAQTPLPAPTGPVLLTVSGDIVRTNHGSAAIFDLAMLESLPPITFSTSTEWTQGVSEFTGVSLSYLLASIGASSGDITATSISDYTIIFPFEEIGPEYPILAYRKDGEEMTLRENGPLWIMYPFDDDERFRTESVFSRALWQLDDLKIDR